MDIQMPHANGFEVLEASRKEPRPFVVFVTAHDRYALKAFDVNAVDYLLKPYDEERFYTSLSKAKEFIEMRTSKNLAGKLIDIVQQHVRSQKDFAEEITIKEKGRFLPGEVQGCFVRQGGEQLPDPAVEGQALLAAHDLEHAGKRGGSRSSSFASIAATSST
jgi:CheY-like chemotaxis protein